MKRRVAFAIALCVTAFAAAQAQQAIQPAVESPGHQYFGDVKLMNQDGQEMRLYSDLMQGKTVVINVMFTTCTGACPVMSATIEKIQTHLGDRVGKDVRLVSISVDPVHDTPAKLKEYAARFHAGPGWYFLTGSKENVEAALRKFGQWVDQPTDHQTLFLIGNERTGLWKKAFALAPMDQLFPIVDSVVDDKGQG
ncbi:MAG TPA: SCO family protein [Thermoanaerobaculia bacterium]|jgi:protein SCO1/2|nr:SCO family protein [Thermoanaerobaculia bacterium]